MSISKCDNPACPIKEQCYRFRKPDHPYRQPYASFKFDFELHECEYFIPYNARLTRVASKD